MKNSLTILKFIGNNEFILIYSIAQQLAYMGFIGYGKLMESKGHLRKYASEMIHKYDEEASNFIRSNKLKQQTTSKWDIESEK